MKYASQKVALNYFIIAAVLFGLQMLFGLLTGAKYVWDYDPLLRGGAARGDRQDAPSRAGTLPRNGRGRARADRPGVTGRASGALDEGTSTTIVSWSRPASA